MTSKEEQLSGFDPNGTGRKGNLFGLPFTTETASVVIMPVPWEVTVSYSAGTAGGPMAVLEASPQIDFCLPDFPEAWKVGVAMESISTTWAERSATLRMKTEPYLDQLASGDQPKRLLESHADLLREVNQASEDLKDWLALRASHYLDQRKIVGVLGGDHSTPLGLISALTQRHESFGVLQIDAHADLRQSYEGFQYSHASIMTNVLQLPQVTKLVQVGIRDYCEEELLLASSTGGRVATWFDQVLREQRFAGETWQSQCREIVAALPEKVYISFDIDGLDPKLCPHTGTPVAGGFEMEEALYLVKQVVLSGRTIIGFDLCEVAPGEDEWDGNVGARILYRLASWAGARKAGLL